MELYQLRYLKEIYAQKSYTKAAEKLLHTTSALTIAIQKLESELGLQLFVKKGRTIEPTAACIRLIPLIDKTLKDAESLYGVMANSSAGYSTVSLGIPDLVFFNSIINMKDHFSGEHIDVQVQQSHQQRVLEDNLSSGALDICILRVLENEKKDYRHVSWREETYWAYVPEKSVYAGMSRITPDVLGSSQLILSREMSDIKGVVTGYLGEYSYTPKSICGDTVGLHSAYNLASYQNGVCIAPKLSMRVSGMKAVPIYPPLKSELIIAASPSGELSHAHRLVKDYILKSPPDPHSVKPLDPGAYEAAV